VAYLRLARHSGWQYGEERQFRRIFNKRAQRITDRRLAPRNVAAIVKQGAARLGFDPSTFGSLRAGFVTSQSSAAQTSSRLRR